MKDEDERRHPAMSPWLDWGAPGLGLCANAAYVIRPPFHPFSAARRYRVLAAHCRPTVASLFTFLKPRLTFNARTRTSRPFAQANKPFIGLFELLLSACVSLVSFASCQMPLWPNVSQLSLRPSSKSRRFERGVH
ncbi:hypothetical protein SRHO_G00017620 [Serrasalmus rhombeus]